MALQTAAAARTAADSRNPPDYTSVTMGELDTLITASDGEVTLTRDTTGKNGVRDIVQTDDSTINLLDTIAAIKAKGYDVRFVRKNGSVVIFVGF